MKKIFLILSTISILLGSANSFASPQLPDYVIYKGDTLPVYSLILEQYFQKIEKADKGSSFGLKFREVSSTNCWRGYQAIYEIKNDSLFLNDIIDCGTQEINKEESLQRVRQIFEDKQKENQVFVNWFSGDFSVPQGELMRGDGVFHQIFEKEILFEVKKGKIINTSKIENYVEDPGLINRKYSDVISDIIFNELKKNYEKGNNPLDCSERFTFLIGKNGEIKKISLTEYGPNEIDDYSDKREYRHCIRQLKNYLENLRFDIIKNKGEPIEEEVIVEIWLNDDGRLENWTN